MRSPARSRNTGGDSASCPPGKSNVGKNGGIVSAVAFRCVVARRRTAEPALVWASRGGVLVPAARERLPASLGFALRSTLLALVCERVIRTLPDLAGVDLDRLGVLRALAFGLGALETAFLAALWDRVVALRADGLRAGFATARRTDLLLVFLERRFNIFATTQSGRRSNPRLVGTD